MLMKLITSARLWASARAAAFHLALILVLAAALLVQTLRIEGLHLWLINRPGLAERLATALADLQKVKDAQPKAAVAQAEANHQPAVRSAAIAEKSNVDAQAYYARGRAAGAAYADAHRVRSTCPAGQPGRADLPGADHAAALNDRSGAATDDVAVSRADFDLLIGNSLRLGQVHQDAQALIASGVAIESADNEN